MKIKNWKQYNEGIFDYFGKESSDKRKDIKKEKFISKINDGINEFDNALLMLNYVNNNKKLDWGHIETFVDSYSNLATLLDDFYNKYVKNNEGDNNIFSDYERIYKKIESTTNQVSKFNVTGLKGFSIGYDPQEILTDAKELLNKHKLIILNK